MQETNNSKRSRKEKFVVLKTDDSLYYVIYNRPPDVIVSKAIRKAQRLNKQSGDSVK